MSTYLLRWGAPGALDEDQWEDAREDLVNGWSHVGSWPVQTALAPHDGDRVVFWRAEGGPVGVLGTGTVLGSVRVPEAGRGADSGRDTGVGRGADSGRDAVRVAAPGRIADPGRAAVPGRAAAPGRDAPPGRASGHDRAVEPDPGGARAGTGTPSGAMVDVAVDAMLPWDHPLRLDVIDRELPEVRWDASSSMAVLADHEAAILLEAVEGGPEPVGSTGRVGREEAVEAARTAYAVSLARAELRLELGEQWDVTSVDVAPFDLLADDGEHLVYVGVAVGAEGPIRFSVDAVEFARAHRDAWRLLMVTDVEVRTQITRGTSELRLDGGTVQDVTEEFFSEISELRPSTYDWLPGVAGADVDAARHLRATTLGGVWNI